MAFQRTNTDPTEVPVQMNVRIPFFLREVLIAVAKERDISQNELVKLSIMKELAPELRELAVNTTRQAGATK